MKQNKPSRQRQSAPSVASSVTSVQRKPLATISPAPGGRMVETARRTRYDAPRFLVDVELDGTGLRITGRKK